MTGRHHLPTPADEASRAEQIAVARNVQDEQGWNAWPTCMDKLGIEE